MGPVPGRSSNGVSYMHIRSIHVARAKSPFSTHRFIFQRLASLSEVHFQIQRVIRNRIGVVCLQCGFARLQGAVDLALVLLQLGDHRPDLFADNRSIIEMSECCHPTMFDGRATSYLTYLQLSLLQALRQRQQLVFILLMFRFQGRLFVLQSLQFTASRVQFTLLIANGLLLLLTLFTDFRNLQIRPNGGRMVGSIKLISDEVF